MRLDRVAQERAGRDAAREGRSPAEVDDSQHELFAPAD
jgi:hypothetical protein